MKKIIGVIPSRMGSGRFPGKPLFKIAGMPMLEHVWHRAKMYKKWDELLVATCDVEIKDFADSKNIPCVMTSDKHERALDRVAEAIENSDFEVNEDDIVLNVQGDEPMMSPNAINQVASNLIKSGMSVATLCEKIESEESYFDLNCVKVVYNSRGNALYFSRSPIPAFRNSSEINLDFCFRHVGLYAYRVSFLKQYLQMGKSELELAEKLEQLTILNQGIDINVDISCAPTGYGVDTEFDLKKVKEELKK